MDKAHVLAIAAHPDDIEFMMAGTLLLLRGKGCLLNYFNIADGSCGSVQSSKEEIARIRHQEAKNAARSLKANYYPSITEDFLILYSEALIKKVAAVIRECRPNILLVPSLKDYMEDHIISARIAVTAAFVRNMPNYQTEPPLAPISDNIAIYHALPYGLRDEIRRKIIPDIFIDISSVLDKKTKLLAMHKSQKDWLDKTQGIDAYLQMMKEMGRRVGKDSNKFQFAEGWQRHSHLGYATEDYNPMAEILGEFITPFVPL